MRKTEPYTRFMVEIWSGDGPVATLFTELDGLVYPQVNSVVLLSENHYTQVACVEVAPTTDPSVSVVCKDLKLPTAEAATHAVRELVAEGWRIEKEDGE